MKSKMIKKGMKEILYVNNLYYLRNKMFFLVECIIFLLLILFPARGHAQGEINNDPNCGCVDIRISNITSNNAVISWISPCLTTAEVRYDTNSLHLTNIAFDERGQDIESSTHYHPLSNLDPNTEYFYQVLQNNEICSEGSFFTGPDISLPDISPAVHGQAFDPNGIPFEEVAIIYLRIQAGNDISSLLSTLTFQQGGWRVNLSPRTENLEYYFWFSNEDILLIEGFLGQPCLTGSFEIPISQSLIPNFVQVQMDECPTELCDGKDNDYDGYIDEDLGTTTCGLGVCEHTVNNCIDGVPQTCDPMEGASQEICDGLDNDCDGLAEDPWGTTTCGLGECEHTIDNCVDGVPQTCDPMEGASQEICDGLDNDCDGQVDDLGTTTCGLGGCEHTIDNCVDGVLQTCDPMEGASQEMCDGLDNDCNGLVDDDLGTTTCGLGECEHTINNCVDGVPQTCDPMEGVRLEGCDGKDNDCDGNIDEELTRPYSNLCGAWNKMCVNGRWVDCLASNPTEEKCDGEDNDCDGNIDEELTRPCSTLCGDGKETCVNGRWVNCSTDIVVDNNAPVPHVDPLPVVKGAGNVILIPPTAMDDCAGIIVATTSDPTSYWSPGTYPPVTWTYDDNNGNISQQTQEVIVEDNKIYLNPDDSIQEAINTAGYGSEIILAEGTYTGKINFNGKAITIRSKNPNEHKVVSATIIDGGGDGDESGSVFNFINGEGRKAVLSGVTIQNGNASLGGGIYCYGSSPTISQCIIQNNKANHGGGIYCSPTSSPEIVNCEIIDNSLKIENGWGGGIYCLPNSSPIIRNCIIKGNSGYIGGGIAGYKVLSSMEITNCIISENTSSFGGGILLIQDCSPSITNCTIVNNSANQPHGVGGGICLYASSSPKITNSILWGNTATNGNEIYFINSDPSIYYSDIKGGWTGTGSNNIDADPLFFDPTAENYYLRTFSPCINRGTDIDAPHEDIEGHLRPQCCKHDIGAREFKGNLDCDGGVDIVDIILCVDHFLHDIDCFEPADMNRDGMVDIVDIILVIDLYLKG